MRRPVVRAIPRCYAPSADWGTSSTTGLRELLDTISSRVRERRAIIIGSWCKVNFPTPVHDHRSPGHQIEGGSLAEIFVARSATRWLRL